MTKCNNCNVCILLLLIKNININIFDSIYTISLHFLKKITFKINFMKKQFSLLLIAMSIILLSVSCKKDDPKEESYVAFVDEIAILDEGKAITIPVVANFEGTKVINVKYTVEEIGCKAGEDFEIVASGNLFFAMSSVQYIGIASIPNSKYDGERKIKLTLTSNDGNLKMGQNGSKKTTIITLNDDEELISFEKESYTVDEGQIVDVAIVLSKPADEDFEAALDISANFNSNDYNYASDALSPYYSETTIRLVFEKGDTKAIIRVKSNNNSSIDGDRTLKITLKSATEHKYYINENNNSSTEIKFTDDDNTPLTSISQLIGRYKLTLYGYNRSGFSESINCVEDVVRTDHYIEIKDKGNNQVEIINILPTTLPHNNLPIIGTVDLENKKLIIKSGQLLTNNLVYKNITYSVKLKNYNESNNSMSMDDCIGTIAGSKIIEFKHLTMPLYKADGSYAQLEYTFSRYILTKQQ